MSNEREYINFELSNGILIGKYEEVFVNIEIAKSVLATRNRYTKESAYPMVVDCSLLKGVDKEARDFFALPSGSDGLLATALLVKSRFDSSFVNFLIKVNLYKSSLPIKVFNNMNDALNWLQQYK